MEKSVFPIGELDIEVLDGDRGKNYPHQDELYEKGHCLFLSAANVTSSGFRFETTVFISKEKDEILRGGKLRRNDIVITTRGTVGNVAYYDECIPYEDIRINSGMLIVRCGKGINSEYIYYVLRSPEFQKQVRSIQTGSAQPQLPKSHFLKMLICVPEMETQNIIASILSALDRRIESNARINDNLEQQAQAFFQELFIDNADPEWAIGTISDLGTVVGGGTPSKAKAEYYTETGIAWITPKDLSINKSKFISHGENDITELGLKNSSATIMPEGTVLFSSRAPIGYIAVAAGEVTTNQGFKSIVPKPEIGTAFVYYFLKHNLPIIEGMASGSTFKEVSGSTMKGVPAVIPGTDTITRFNDFCTPIFAQQKILEEQNQSLVALRDNLLPKLMSGEIDVSDIQL